MVDKKDKFKTLTKWGLTVPSLNECDGDKEWFDTLVKTTQHVFDELVIVCKRRKDGLQPDDYGIAVANAVEELLNYYEIKNLSPDLVDYDSAKLFSLLIPLTTVIVKGRGNIGLFPLNLLIRIYLEYLKFLSQELKNEKYKQTSKSVEKIVKYNGYVWFEKNRNNAEELAGILNKLNRIKYPPDIYRIIIGYLQKLECFKIQQRITLSEFEHFALFIKFFFDDNIQNVLMNLAGVNLNNDNNTRTQGAPKRKISLVKRVDHSESNRSFDEDNTSSKDTDITDFF